MTGPSTPNGKASADYFNPAHNNQNLKPSRNGARASRGAGKQAVSQTPGSGRKMLSHPTANAGPSVNRRRIAGLPRSCFSRSQAPRWPSCLRGLRCMTPRLSSLSLYLSAALLLWFPGRWWRGVAGLRRNRDGYAFYAPPILGMASLVISAAMSSDVWLSFAGTVWRRLGAGSQVIAFFIAGVIAADVFLYRPTAKTLMLGMEAAGGISSLYAILQYFGFDPLHSAQLLYIWLASRRASARHAYSSNVLCNVPASRYFDRGRVPLERDTSAVEADARIDPASLAHRPLPFRHAFGAARFRQLRSAF